MDLNNVIKEIKKAVIGKDDVIEDVIITLLARGHVLLEDIPGVGKTNLALALSKSIKMDYSRIQLTSDVMPSDIIGFNMYNPNTSQFEYKQGIAYTHLLLADEINRTSSKTQAALLELMEEKQMSVDGKTYKLPEPFFVIATQNPFGSAGTQLLPDSQLDRFMVRLSLGYPNLEDEVRIIKDRKNINPIHNIESILTPELLIQCQKESDNVFVHDEIYKYIVEIVQKTRSHSMIKQGASPRGSLALMKLSKARAYLHNRDYVIPEDVRDVAVMGLAHRIIFNYDAKIKDLDEKKIILDIVNSIDEPRV